MRYYSLFFFFFFNDTATTEIYTLSLHDALPISPTGRMNTLYPVPPNSASIPPPPWREKIGRDTSELQSRGHLVCRLLLEKKKNRLSRITVAKAHTAKRFATFRTN